MAQSAQVPRPIRWVPVALDFCPGEIIGVHGYFSSILNRSTTGEQSNIVWKRAMLPLFGATRGLYPLNQRKLSS